MESPEVVVTKLRFGGVWPRHNTCYFAGTIFLSACQIKQLVNQVSAKIPHKVLITGSRGTEERIVRFMKT